MNVLSIHPFPRFILYRQPTRQTLRFFAICRSRNHNRPHVSQYTLRTLPRQLNAALYRFRIMTLVKSNRSDESYSTRSSRARCNENLEQLILMGNPCTDYEYYREYVVATLPQLRELDMREIERSERIKALQVYARARDDVIEAYRCYEKTRLSRQAPRRRDATLQITEINETVSSPRVCSVVSYRRFNSWTLSV